MRVAPKPEKTIPVVTPEIREKAKKKLQQARSNLVLSQPFYSWVIMSIDSEADEKTRKTWVDGLKLGYNPGYIASLSIDEIQGLMAEDVLTCALSHQTRRNGRDKKNWNKASDEVVRNLIKESGMTLPCESEYNPSWAGKSIE